MADFQYSTNLLVQNDYAPYRKEVVRYLDLLKTTHVGRTLLDFIGNSPLRRTVRIVPFKPTKNNPVNASANSDNALHVFAKGHPVMKPLQVGNVQIMLPTRWVGTGYGTDVRVEYHPATWRQFNLNMHGIPPGSGPGEVLLHELIHALRMAWGRYLRTTVLEHMHMDDFEEFCAIVAANMYRSERGFKVLRLDHHQHKSVVPSQAASEAYHANFKNQFALWFTSQKDFCLELAASPAAFNPLKVAAVERGDTLRTTMRLP